jgi:nitrogenase-stabilizing/protective protein
LPLKAVQIAACILKRFYQRHTPPPCPPRMMKLEQFRHYRGLLAGYQDFVKSTPAAEKVFKVFQDAGGTQHVRLAKLRDSLPARSGATVASFEQPARA